MYFGKATFENVAKVQINEDEKALIAFYKSCWRPSSADVWAYTVEESKQGEYYAGLDRSNGYEVLPAVRERAARVGLELYGSDVAKAYAYYLRGKKLYEEKHNSPNSIRLRKILGIAGAVAAVVLLVLIIVNIADAPSSKDKYAPDLNDPDTVADIMIWSDKQNGK